MTTAARRQGVAVLYEQRAGESSGVCRFEVLGSAGLAGERDCPPLGRGTGAGRLNRALPLRIRPRGSPLQFHLRQFQHRLSVSTRGKGLYEITHEVARWLDGQKVRQGLLTVFIQHTSASLTIQENADPDVIHDLNTFFGRIVPEDNRLYRHTVEGPDDMPAHIRAALTPTQLSIPVAEGRMTLGTWQGIYVFEHRGSSHRRSVVLHLLAE